MKFKAIIFDMDGTIVDTEPLWHKATAQLLHDEGHTLSPAQELDLQKRLSGLDTQASCTLIRELFNSSNSVELLVTRKRLLARQLYAQGISFIPGFTDFHKKVSAIPLKTGIATNASSETIQITCQHLGLEQFFGSHIYGIGHVNNKGKPQPAVYLHAADQLSIAASQCIAIEDSAHGIAAARAAGMFCIGINTGHNRNALQAAHLIVDSYEQIDLQALLF